VAGQKIKRFQIHCRFRQPHALWFAAKTEFEITNPPQNLGLLIPAVRERHNYVVVHLCDCRSVPGEQLLALLVRIKDRLIDLGSLFRKPGKQGRAKVEADFRIVIRNLDDALLSVQNTRRRIGCVALRGDTFVPIMVGVSGVLDFDGLEPGIFSRRLVEVSVDTDVAIHSYSVSELLQNNRKERGPIERWISPVEAIVSGTRSPSPPQQRSFEPSCFFQCPTGTGRVSSDCVSSK
jgi:hypothetical protein